METMKAIISLNLKNMQ